jgi:hypothetical protein
VLCHLDTTAVLLPVYLKDECDRIPHFLDLIQYVCDPMACLSRCSSHSLTITTILFNGVLTRQVFVGLVHRAAITVDVNVSGR